MRPDATTEPIAHRFRDAAARCGAEPIAWADHRPRVSVSAGVVVSRPAEKPGALLARADAVMFAEKVDRRA